MFQFDLLCGHSVFGITAKSDYVLWYNGMHPLIEHAVEEITEELPINTTASIMGKRCLAQIFGYSVKLAKLRRLYD